jgi:hypothetical protein
MAALMGTSQSDTPLPILRLSLGRKIMPDHGKVSSASVTTQPVCGRKIWAILLCLTAVCLLVTSVLAQGNDVLLTPKYVTVPLHGNTLEQAKRESDTGQTLPLWQVELHYGSGTTYRPMIMGIAPQYPFSTHIPTIVVPVVFWMPDGTLFDPQAPDNCTPGHYSAESVVLASPIFQSSGPFGWGGVPIGSTQYVDALQRLSFYPIWAFPGGDNGWHTLLDVQATTSYVIPVPQDQGRVYNANCGKIGVINLQWLQPLLEAYVIPSLASDGVNPTTFPILLSTRVVLNKNGTELVSRDCCALGYHSAFGSPMQVYSVATFDNTGNFLNSEDITPLSHEVAEAVNDPSGRNATPGWGHSGQVRGCQYNYEVGDPLTGKLNPPITLSGFTFHPQELATFGWFYRVAFGGGTDWYSTNDTFTQDAGPFCH